MTFQNGDTAMLKKSALQIPAGATVTIESDCSSGVGSLRHESYKIVWRGRRAIVWGGNLAASPIGGFMKVGGRAIL